MTPSNGPNRHFFKRSSEDVRRIPLAPANVNLLQRPLNAFARRRLRELSQIREASSSSVNDETIKKKKTVSVLDGNESKPALVQENEDSTAKLLAKENPPSPEGGTRTIESRAASSISLPLGNIPERNSSASIFRHAPATSRQSSIQDFPSWKLPPPAAAGQRVPERGASTSPVRRSIQQDAVSSDGLRRIPSRTLIRTTAPLDILDCPSSKHSRFEMDLHLSSPLFVGGGTAEGSVKLVVDGGPVGRNKGTMYITKLSVDIIGVEEVNDGRRWVFLSLACELFDEEHPPPASLVTSQTSLSTVEMKWALKPSSTTIPFSLNLPLNLGPPPYLSKQARIRYILCPTAIVEAGSRPNIIRHSWNIQMLTVHDPEKALASLPSPLLASDIISFSSGSTAEKVKLTAGLHRQTWISGSRIFVDVHISNNSSKTIKKIETQLEKTVLWYAHAAAGTVEKSASYLRPPRKSEVEIVTTTVLKKGKEFSRIGENATDVRTMELGVPKDHVTISTGRYFEIRYFVNVIVSVTRFKSIAVQLPVTIIHMNSLDIVPNSLAQVAAAIEAKRARTVPVSQEHALYPPYHQGQAFTAPRRQSLEQMRSTIDSAGDLDYEELVTLQREVDSSPRRPATRRVKSKSQLHNSIASTHHAFSGVNHSQLDGFSDRSPSRLSTTSQYQQAQHSACCRYTTDHHRHHHRNRSSMSSRGPHIPRLQLSTSGLGFSESDFELEPDSPPKKVMLSENDRKVIHQQRELKLARQRSIAHHRTMSDSLPSNIRLGQTQDIGPGIRRSYHVHGRSRSRTVPMTRKDPRLSVSSISDTSVKNRDLSSRDHEHWGWKNVAAMPGAVPIGPKYSSDGMDWGIGTAPAGTLEKDKRIVNPIRQGYANPTPGRRSLDRPRILVDGSDGSWTMRRH